MKVITEDQVRALGISPLTCVEWVDASFRSKPLADMPPKISVHPFTDSFYTAMPCFHPDVGRVGVKVISRIPGGKPALKSKMMLFEAGTAELLALVDTNWITAMRTGAVTALAARLFASDFSSASFAMVGLGTIARSTLSCLLAIVPGTCDIWLLEYKDHAEQIMREFASDRVRFHVTSDRRELVARTNVLFSCVTVMHEMFLPVEAYPPGYLCVPVHVRGFQNCDVVFDEVFGDDAGHMRDWKNFGGFRRFAELSDVLLGRAAGRMNASQRILSYNYGLGLHDLWFASRIYDLVNK